jgi:hypothetical protein
MAKRRLVILTTFTLVFTGVTDGIQADIGLSLGWDVDRVRRGAFVLSDASMPFLLSIGYSLVTVTSRNTGLAAIPGFDKAEGFLKNIGPYANQLLQNLVDEDVYFLQKGKSLYRCQEENSLPFAITCWRFDPVPLTLSGTPQRLPRTNMLLGKWLGFFLDSQRTQNQMVPVKFTFDDNSVSVDVLNDGKPLQAVYDWDEHGGAIVTATDPMLGERRFDISFKTPGDITAKTGTS